MLSTQKKLWSIWLIQGTFSKDIAIRAYPLGQDTETHNQKRLVLAISAYDEKDALTQFAKGK